MDMLSLAHQASGLTLDAGGAVIIAGSIQAAATVAAVIVGGVIAGGYRRRAKEAISAQRASTHAEALRSIHDYLEAPYRIRRRDGSATARMQVTSTISDIQSRMHYYEDLLRLQSTPEIYESFAETVRAARNEAGQAMSRAWKEAPTISDDQVPIEFKIDAPETRTALQKTISLMRASSEARH
jgi:outer membrane murein-binding lipoprotein Lpp